MSQRNRILTASITLVAVLTLAAPPPTHAAGLPAIPAWSRAWSWLIDHLPAGIASKPAERQEKEGGMINPDGRTTGTPPAPTPQNGLQDPGGS
jgi:hypothetical protein